MNLNGLSKLEMIEALKEYSQNESELLMSQAEEADIKFSEEHEKKVKDIFHKHKHKSIFMVFFSTPARKAASIFVACILVSLVTVMSVDAFRVPILNYFTEKLDGGDTNIQVSIGTGEEAPPETIEEYLSPSYIPDGYKIVSEEKNVNVCMIVYSNDETNQEIIFSQSIITSGDYVFNTEEGTLSDIKVGLYDGKRLSLPPNDETIYWSDGVYQYEITGFYISVDELIEIGESVK